MESLIRFQRRGSSPGDGGGERRGTRFDDWFGGEMCLCESELQVRVNFCTGVCVRAHMCVSVPTSPSPRLCPGVGFRCRWSRRGRESSTQTAEISTSAPPRTGLKPPLAKLIPPHLKSLTSDLAEPLLISSAISAVMRKTPQPEILSMPTSAALLTPVVLEAACMSQKQLLSEIKIKAVAPFGHAGHFNVLKSFSDRVKHRHVTALKIQRDRHPHKKIR